MKETLSEWEGALGELIDKVQSLYFIAAFFNWHFSMECCIADILDLFRVQSSLICYTALHCTLLYSHISMYIYFAPLHNFLTSHHNIYYWHPGMFTYLITPKHWLHLIPISLSFQLVLHSTNSQFFLPLVSSQVLQESGIPEYIASLPNITDEEKELRLGRIWLSCFSSPLFFLSCKRILTAIQCTFISR